MCLVDPSRVAASRVSDARRFDAFFTRAREESRAVAASRASRCDARSTRVVRGVVDVAPLGPRDEIFSTFFAPGAREKS
jgi:hypothetical protein